MTKINQDGLALEGLPKPDKDCIDATAKTWIEHGGDAIGLSWGWTILRDRIRELSNG